MRRHLRRDRATSESERDPGESCVRRQDMPGILGARQATCRGTWWATSSAKGSSDAFIVMALPPRSRLPRMAMWLVLIFLLLIAGPALNLASGRASLRGDWRTASNRSAGLAPDPASHPEAVVQVYASRAFSWRGAFSDHMWLAVKPQGADALHALRGHRLVPQQRSFGRVGRRTSVAPDAEWFGAAPRVVRDVRGARGRRDHREAARRPSPPIRSATRTPCGPAPTATRFSRTSAARFRNCT